VIVMKSLAKLALWSVAALTALAQAPPPPPPAAPPAPAAKPPAPAPVAPVSNAGIRTVYVMPMAGGLDQHLADHITRDHVYQVVTDARIADAFLTDKIGSAFEQKMAELFPSASNANAGRGGLKSIGSRGTIFLVDAKSRQVVWSDFEKPVDTTPEALSREADRITKKLAGVPSK
jgi:hypothetical protein